MSTKMSITNSAIYQLTFGKYLVKSLYLKIKHTWQDDIKMVLMQIALSKGCHLDVVRGPSTPHDPESDAGGSLSSWQSHPSR
jgi:hypothetical protein